MTQLKVFAPLPVDLSSFPCAHIRQLTAVSNTSLWDLTPGFCRHIAQTHMQIDNAQN